MEHYNLEISHLKKQYKDFIAVHDLSFQVKAGEIYALLGPNGAGKTSTFESVTGLLEVSGGTIKVNGKTVSTRNLRSLNKEVGVQLQAAAFPNNMKVYEIIRLVSLYYGVTVNKDLYKRLKIDELARKKMNDMSVGQKRRVTLYLAVMHKPRLIILDEPTAGLDVLAKADIHEILKELKKEGTSILISSHDMGEIEKLADRIGVIVKGELIREATALELTNDSSGVKKIIINTKNGYQQYIPVFQHHECQIEELENNYAVIYTRELQNTLADLMNYIVKKLDTVIDLRVEQPTLEEVFVQLTAL